MKALTIWSSGLRQHKNLLLVTFVALILRLGVVVPVHSQKYTSDEVEYIGMARNLAQGGEFIDSNGDRSIRAPLFVYGLSCLFRWVGPGLLLSHFLGCLFSALTIPLIYYLSKQLWNDERAALLASWTASVYPGLIIYAGLLQTETLYIVFFLFAFLLAMRMADRPSVSNAISLGVVSALATLTRVVFFGFFPILLLISWGINRNTSLHSGRYLFLSILVWCLVLCPWTVRNYSLSHEFVPISSGGGNSLLTGNNPFATGTWRAEKGFEKWFQERAAEHGVAHGEQLNEFQRSALSKTIAIEFISTHPMSTIQLALKKVHIFWIYPITHTDSYIPIQLIAVIFDFILLLGVALGIVAAPNSRGRTLMIAAAVLFFFFIQIVLHSEARFRLPLIPFLCLFFGWGITAVVDADQRQILLTSRKKYIAAGVLVTVVILAYIYTGWLFMKGSV